jgi:hypothetical protein
MLKICPKCNKEKMQKSAGNYGTISAKTVYDEKFSNSCGTHKYVCIGCGYIEEYADNPKVFTDEKYRYTNSNDERDI